jgi:hypothetical protein
MGIEVELIYEPSKPESGRITAMEAAAKKLEVPEEVKFDYITEPANPALVIGELERKLELPFLDYFEKVMDLGMTGEAPRIMCKAHKVEYPFEEKVLRKYKHLISHSGYELNAIQIRISPMSPDEQAYQQAMLASLRSELQINGYGIKKLSGKHYLYTKDKTCVNLEHTKNDAVVAVISSDSISEELMNLEMSFKNIAFDIERDLFKDHSRYEINLVLSKN